jgi:hypothetical protein
VRRLRRLASLVGAIVVILHGQVAAGQTSGGGVLDPDYVRATAQDLGGGTFSGAPIPSAEPSSVAPYDWSRADTGAMCVLFEGPIPPPLLLLGSVTPLPGIFLLPNVPVRVAPLVGAPSGAVRMERSGGVPRDAIYVGDLVADVATPTTPDRDLLVVPRCALPGEPLPPEPPSAAEIWQQTPLPRATIHADPPGTRSWPGVVRMESRFWADALPDTHAAVTLVGFDVDVFARPIAYAWLPGDGTVAVGAGPGSADAPVPAHYTRRGDYGVTLYVVWVGFAHTSQPGLGLDFGDQFLGTVTLPERIGYHEVEVRALLHS